MENLANNTAAVNSSKNNKYSDRKIKRSEVMEESAQMRFVEAQKSNTDLGKRSFEKHSLLYHWTGSVWARLQESAAETMAFAWLRKSCKATANDKLAKSCIACLKYDVAEIPNVPEETIIPLRNAWLKLNVARNRIELVAPNKGVFVDYNLNIELPEAARSRYLGTITVNDEFVDHRTNPHLFDEAAGVEIYKPTEPPAGSLFKQFIESSMPNPKIRDLLQEYCGYTLMPTIPYQVAQVWEGNGSNGKSVLISIMEALHKNSRSVDLDNLTPTELNKLIGASLVVSPETPKRSVNEQVLKKCISGDLLSVRALYENSIDYRPTAKWIISCNEFPHLQDATNGIWRRLHIFRWETEFTGGNIIPELEKKIIENELKIVLDWCLIGVLRLMERKGFDTSSIDQQKTEKKVASDNVLQFMRRVDLAVDESRDIFQTAKGDIYADYREYCEVNGFSPGSSEKFWTKAKNTLKEITEQRRRVKGNRVIYVNLRYRWGDRTN